MEWSNRAYWGAYLDDDTFVSERTVDWDALDKKKIKVLALKLPGGQSVRIDKRSPSFQFFQFKYGETATKGRMEQIAKQFPDLPRTKDTFHYGIVIGAVVDKVGNCFLVAYDYRTGELLSTIDNAYDIKFERIGRINFKLQQIDLPEEILSEQEFEEV